jgi:outer membrane protein assembly factor BamB
MDHHLYSVNAADGSVNWKIDLGGAVASTPTVYEGSIYVGSFDRKLFQISLDGEILNTFETENWVWGSPVVQDGVLYAADMAGWVYAINVTDGMTEIWRTAASGRGIRPSPLVTEDYIVVAGRDGHIDWLDVEDGSIAIQREVQAEVLSDILLIQPSESLNIAQPLVVISTVNHSQILVAFTLNDGTQFWVYGR